MRCESPDEHDRRADPGNYPDDPCQHCSCCPEFCCWCDELKPTADPESPDFDAGAACDAAYDDWRDGMMGDDTEPLPEGYDED